MRSERLWDGFIAAAIGVGLLGGCQAPEPAPAAFDTQHDAVHGAPIPTANEAAFVTRTSLAVLGRPPLDAQERNELATELSGGAGALVDHLTSEPYQDEFVRHWSSVLLDMFRVYRLPEGTRTLEICWHVSTVDTADAQANLARHVASQPADAAWPGGSFTMRDVLEGALRADDLRAPLRANLFAQMATPLSGNQVSEPNRRADFWTRFEASYLNRQLLCLSCHNNEFSVSGNASDWDRHSPLPDLLEEGVFGRSSARNRLPPNLHADFRYEGVFGGSLQPWGMSNCGTFNPSPTPQRTDAGFTCPAVPPEAFAPSDPGYAASLSDVCFYPRESATERVPPVAQFALTDPNVVGSVFRLDQILARGMASMASTGLAGLDGLTPNPESGELTRAVAVGPDGIEASERAFATMVAANMVEKVWEEIFGSRLTLAHYIPRLPESRDALLQFTQLMVQNPLGDPWSLRALLRAMVERPEFNAAAGQGDPDEDEYTLPRLFDPWVPSDPRPAPDPAGLCSAGSSPMNPGVPTYEGCVRGLLRVHRCVNCHSNPDEPAGPRFALADVESVKQYTIDQLGCEDLAASPACSAVVDCAALADKPASTLAVRVSCTQPSLRMPQGLAPLPQSDIDAIVRWVTAMAPTGVRGPTPDLPMGTTQNQVDHNGVGDRVAWKSPFQLTYTAGTALGLEPWGAGPFPLTGYPTRAVAESAGHHLLESIPGGRGFSILGLLSWERAHGESEPCRVGTGPDRIDALVDAAVDDGANVESVVRQLKQSMLGESELGIGDAAGAADDERALLDSVLDGPQLSDTVEAGNATEVDEGLRRVCNVFLKSPLFALSYLEPEGATGPAPPRPGVPSWPTLCNGRLDCRPLLDTLTEILNQCWLARPISCLAAISDTITDALRDIRLPVAAPQETLSQACDHAPHLVPSENDPRLQSNLLVLPLASGRLKQVHGTISVLRNNRWKELKRGSQLEFGDALIIEEGARIEIAANGVVFETGRHGMEKAPDAQPRGDYYSKHHALDRDRKVWIVLVNGPDASNGPPISFDPSIERGDPLEEPKVPEPRNGVQPAWAINGEGGLWYSTTPR